jgi:hypothetical protein
VDAFQSLELRCELPFGDGRRFVHNELVVRGTARSPVGISQIRVEVDGAAEEAPIQEPPGQFEVVIDTSGWPAGSRTVTVRAIDAEGAEAVQRGEVEVEPYAEPVSESRAADGEGTALRCQLPRGPLLPALPLRVRGWAYARSGVERVEIFVDGRSRHEALYGLTRPDVQRRLARPDAVTCGYALTLDPVEFGPGPHLLTVVAFPRGGEPVGIERSFSCAEGTKTPGDQEPTVPDEPSPAPRATALNAGELDPEAEAWRERALVAEAEVAAMLTQRAQAQRAEERALGLLRVAEERRREAERELASYRNRRLRRSLARAARRLRR